MRSLFLLQGCLGLTPTGTAILFGVGISVDPRAARATGTATHLPLNTQTFPLGPHVNLLRKTDVTAGSHSCPAFTRTWALVLTLPLPVACPIGLNKQLAQFTLNLFLDYVSRELRCVTQNDPEQLAVLRDTWVEPQTFGRALEYPKHITPRVPGTQTWEGPPED